MSSSSACPCVKILLQLGVNELHKGSHDVSLNAMTCPHSSFKMHSEAMQMLTKAYLYVGLSADFDMSQYQHPNRIAPRCLPCNYTDPAEGPPSNKTYVGFRAPRVRSQPILYVLAQ